MFLALVTNLGLMAGFVLAIGIVYLAGGALLSGVFCGPMGNCSPAPPQPEPARPSRRVRAARSAR